MKDKIKKLITGGEWSVAYRKRNESTYMTATVPDGQWCADPFEYEVDGEHYIFVEQYVSKDDKGGIGYFKYKDGIPVNKGIVINNSFHMSYPCIFEYKGKHYMIPESSANNTIDLYLAESFPTKWVKTKTLINGEKYVDSTVFFAGKDIYLISYTMSHLYEVVVFSLDMEKLILKKVSSKKYQTNIGRPAGRLFYENNHLFRPAQDCSRKYGEQIIIYEVDSINSDGILIEHEVKRISSNDVLVENNPQRIHHLTGDSEYEVIDVYKEKLDLLHVPRILIRSRRR